MAAEKTATAHWDPPGPGRSPVERYLSRLAVELAARRLPQPKAIALLDEVRHHLDCAIAEGLEAGESRVDAEADAVALFGPADRLAGEWIEADRSELPILGLGLASAGGAIVGTAVGVPAGLSVLSWLGGELMLPAVGLLLGLAVGVCQWLFIRRVVATRPGWIVGTAVGAAVGLTAGTVVVELLALEKRHLPDELVAMVLIGACLGGSIGWLQWRLGLPSRRRSHAWVAIHTVALAAGLAVGALLATVGFGDLRTVGGLATLTVTAACALGCAGSVASGRWLFGA